MPLHRVYPDYGTPGNPNMDPYYLSPAEEATLDAEAAQKRADVRDDLIDAVAETLSDTNDVDVTWERFARAVVALLEARGVLRFEP